MGVKLPPDEIEIVPIEEFEQQSEEWFAARLGIVTASVMSSVLAEGEGKMRRKLLYRLAGERITGAPAETYSNRYMERGKAMEEEAREHFAFVRGLELTRVAFARRTIHHEFSYPLVVGCSPDSLIGNDGALEIKTMMPELLLETMERGTPPPEHRAQLQGTLWVTGRKWIELQLFYSGPRGTLSPTFTFLRDEPYIKQLATAVESFEYDVREIVKRRS